MMELTINEELLLHVRRNYKNQAAAAKAMGVTDAYLSKIIKGKCAPSKKVLDAIGYERKISFVKKCL